MVDTWAATAAGAFALTENNLYTVEAFRDYLARLAPDGMLSLTRWYLEPPDQLLRLVSLARAALAELGIGDPRPAHHGRARDRRGRQRARPGDFLFKGALHATRRSTGSRRSPRGTGFEVLYSPLTRPANDFTRLVEAADPERVLARLPSDVSPAARQQPVLLPHRARPGGLRPRWRAGSGARRTWARSCCSACSCSPRWWWRLHPRARCCSRAPPRGARRAGGLPCLSTSPPGGGFIMVEVALVQKCILFLGHPVYALTVVLFALLLFSAAGQHLTGRMPRDASAAAPRCCWPWRPSWCSAPSSWRRSSTGSSTSPAGCGSRGRAALWPRSASRWACRCPAASGCSSRGPRDHPLGLGRERRRLGAGLLGGRGPRDALGLRQTLLVGAGLLPGGLRPGGPGSRGGSPYRCRGVRRDRQVGGALAPAARGVGDRGRPPPEPAVDRRGDGARAHDRARVRLRLHLCPGNLRVSGATNPATTAAFRVRQRPSLRGPRCATAAAPSRVLPEPSGPRHRARRLLQPAARPDPRRAGRGRCRALLVAGRSSTATSAGAPGSTTC